MIQFYCPDIADTLTLPESDSGHCVRVLRMTTGDTISVVDGRGHRFVCRLAEAHPRHARLEVVESLDCPPVWNDELTVMVAPTKQMERIEWMLEKLVEIGINRFIPVRCARSERKETKTERLTKIAVSAMKQSLKATLPEICEMVPLRRALELTAGVSQRFVGYCDDTVERRLLARTLQPHRDTAVLIGPEGDFSPDEIQLVTDAGFVPVTMGDNRLRTETAALVAADTFHIINQLSQ